MVHTPPGFRGSNFEKTPICSPLLSLKSSGLLVRHTLGAWEVTGIVTAQTGGPLTVLAGRDAALTGLGTDRAQYLGGPA